MLAFAAKMTTNFLYRDVGYAELFKRGERK